MNPIVQAIALGYGEDEIIKYLSKTSPSLSKSIAKALGSGHSVSNILSFLSKTMQDDEYDTGLSQEAGHKKVAERRERITKELLKTAASSGALYGAAQMVPGAIQSIAGAFKKNPSPPAAPAIGPTPMANAPVQPDTSQIPKSQGNIQQTMPPQPQQALATQEQLQTTSSPPEIDSGNILKEMGIEDQVKNLKSRGNDVQAITAAANAILKPHQKKWLEGKIKEGKAAPLNELIEDFIGKNPEQKAATPPQLAQDDIVATPSGEVGTLKDLRKTEGLVEEGGKLHKVKINELQRPNETVVQTVSRLLEIPEIDKSALINYWSYDPEGKELFLMFHNGETYKYLDVPEELEEELLESSVSPKTKGENQFGAWAQEDPMSRGATFIQKLIAHSKYKKAKKGEAANPFYRKLRKGYDYWSKLRS